MRHKSELAHAAHDELAVLRSVIENCDFAFRGHGEKAAVIRPDSGGVKGETPRAACAKFFDPITEEVMVPGTLSGSPPS